MSAEMSNLDRGRPFVDFAIRLQSAGRDAYAVSTGGPAGEASGRFELPYTDAELGNLILRVGRAGDTRRGAAPEVEAARDLGRRLFAALFEGPVLESFRSAQQLADKSGSGMRLLLSLAEVPELQNVPWELLHDGTDFLAMSASTPIVREVSMPAIRAPLRSGLPLRILGVTSSPTDVPALDLAAERAVIERSLQGATEAGAATITWLEHASLRDLNAALRRDEYHILHFAGHGGFNPQGGEGVLVFEADDGSAEMVGADRLATILRDRRVQLVVLNTSPDAGARRAQSTATMATSLVRRGVAAVAHLQFELSDRTAILFSRSLYGGIAEGQSIDRVVTEARLEMFATLNSVEWAAPVLTMQSGDGRLFDFRASSGEQPGATDQAEPPLTPVPDAVSDGPDGTILLAGQEHALRTVEEELRAGAAGRLGRPAVVVITGPHGVGKTTLARRAADAVGTLFPDGAWQVQMHPGDGPGAALAGLLANVEAPTESAAPTDLNLEDLTARYRRALTGRGVVVIVDGVPDASTLALFTPPDERSAVIATTEEAFEAPNATVVPLESPTQADVDDLLSKLGIAADDPSARSLRDRVGQITVADVAGFLQSVAAATGFSLQDLAVRAAAAGLGAVVGGSAAGSSKGSEPPESGVGSELLPSPFRRSGYSSDMVPSSGPISDHLQMEAEVEALSWVVSARDASPPLSIGLFGAWGTGKSTFMRLMQTRIEAIAKESREAHAVLEDHPACEHVRQITFNAWHYADANLWASLVTHIFDELAGPTPDLPASEYRNLIDRLETTRSLRQDAETRKELAATERTRRLGQLDDVKRDRTEKTRKLDRGDVDPSLVLGDQELLARAKTIQGTLGTVGAGGRRSDSSLSSWLTAILGDPTLLRRAVEMIPAPATRATLLAILDRPDVQEALRRATNDPTSSRALARLLIDGALAGDFDDLVPDAATREQLAELGRGIRAAYDDALTVGDVARTLRSVRGRARYLLNLVIRSAARQRVLALASVSAVIAVVAGMAWYVLANGRDLLALATSALGLLGMATAGVRVVRDPLRKLDNALDFAVDLVQVRARQQLDVLAAREHALEREVQELTYAEHAAERDIEDIRQGRRLYRYLEERATSADYQPYLGIIARIRRDFETLTTLMDQGRESRDDDFRKRRKARRANQPMPQPPMPQPPTDGATVPQDLPAIDRVILYIDDLDRCPADRVVQVLEAVHLLLALKLFVVVVGVDPRWLMRSLRHHYVAQLSPTGSQLSSWEGDASYWESTPENYLEKIFQVPFTLRPMTPSGYQALIADVLRPPTEDDETADTDGTGSPTTSGQGSASVASPPTGGSAVPGAHGDPPQIEPLGETPVPGSVSAGGTQAGNRPTGPTSPTSPTDESASDAPATGADTHAPERGAEDGAAPVDGSDASLATRRYSPPPQLAVTPAELAFIQSLSPFVPTPRSAKRLANTYRLIKVLRSTVEAEGDDPARYEIPLTLLGIVIGYPALAPTVFRDLQEAADDDWPAFVGRAIGGRAAGQPEHENGTGPKRRKRPTLAEVAEAGSLDESIDGRSTAREWKRLSGDLASLPGTTSATSDLAVWLAWAGVVERFSFDSSRASVVERELSPT